MERWTNDCLMHFVRQKSMNDGMLDCGEMESGKWRESVSKIDFFIRKKIYRKVKEKN